MEREESQYPKDWFRVGDREIERARNLLKLGDLEGAGFNIQQAVEKYLKGYLLSKGWVLKRIHNLETLLNEAIGFDPSFEMYRAYCQKTTQYYVEERYPFTIASMLNDAEIKESLSAAESIIIKIKALTGA